MTEDAGALPHDHPMARFRRLAATLADAAAAEDCPPELAGDCRWFSEAVADYDERAAGGLQLAAAFGLNGAGPAAWWNRERLARRDALLRRARTEFFADLSLHAAANQILNAAARGARSATPPQSGPEALLAEAARIMPVPQSTRMITEILEIR